jgi:NAD(P)-dependent dehydrogenase (short-subunit alcohol dehydrogenase family)
MWRAEVVHVGREGWRRTAPDDTPSSTEFFPGDLWDPEVIRSVTESIVATLGGVDFLVNNAAAVRPFLGGTTTVPDEE